MGHLNGSNDAYRRLQKRLDQKVQLEPDSPTLIKILRILFSEQDVELANKLPHNLTSLSNLSKKLKISKDELDSRLTAMARKGLVVDLENKGQRFFTLLPVVIGFFEMTFMRLRPDMPMKDLALLFDEYFVEYDYRFARNIFSGRTQLFRSLVREEVIPADSYTEVLDWERASHIVKSATTTAVGICQCHHTALHKGQACDKPQEVCMTFNYAADYLIRNGIARSITKNESMDILQKCKEAGLAQTADNVQNKVTFICNCCGCCCHVMKGIKAVEPRPAIITSNFIMEVEPEKCKGCGKCSKACPIGAINIDKTTGRDNKEIKWAVNDERACLGCGVCATVCKTGAAHMKPRPARTLVPETVFDQRVMMAIERGKLADLLFDDPTRLSHRALSSMIRAVERAAPVKAFMASQSLNSAFLKTIVKEAKKLAPEVTELVT
ncbi:MAG: 4Fe-4S dicluster domain-containing protein [Deltaproteobacteria bacterium]